jgi:hypothetical protein
MRTSLKSCKTELTYQWEDTDVEWSQTPTVTLSNQSQDCREVIPENNCDKKFKNKFLAGRYHTHAEPSTVDKPGDLEIFFLLRTKFRFRSWVIS